MSRLRGHGAALLACVLMAAGGLAAPAEGQTRQTPRRSRMVRQTPHAGSWEVGGGVLRQGGFDLGSRDAELTRNPTSAAGPYDLFASSTALAAGVGAQGRLAVYLSKSLAVEGGVRVTRPVLTVGLTGDAESAPDLSADERLTQYVIDGSLLWHFPPFAGRRAVAFAGGGAGHIRDLHQGNDLIETGTEYHATAGLKWWLNARPHRLGLRGEAGLSVRDGGFDFRDGRRTVPFVAASLTWLF